MIATLKFRHILIDELCKFYDSPTTDQMDMLHSLFGNTAEHTLKRAVTIVIKKHKFKSFPMPAEISSAIDEARMERARDSVEPDAQREYCDRCYGMGIKLVKRHDDFYCEEVDKATPCHCSHGQRIKRSWQQHYKTHKYYRAKIQPDKPKHKVVAL